MQFTQGRLFRISQLERWHFWFVGRRFLVDRLLGAHLAHPARTVLDLGCGTGLMVEALTEKGHRVVGMDMRPEGLYATRRALPQAELVQADAMHLPLRDDSFDAVILLDVLEHIDDIALLANLYEVLKPKGILLVTVPAMPWLWSYRDRAAGHLRRYTHTHLRRALVGARFRVREVRYYHFSLMPVLGTMRLLGRRGPRLRDLEEKPRPLLNHIMAHIVRFEVRLSDWVPWPWGTSLVAVGCKEPFYD